jgi:hypothetical protein
LTGDETVDPKMLVIASLIDQAGGNGKEFLKRMNELQNMMQPSDASAASPSPDSFAMTGELSAEQSAQVAAATDGSNIAVAAQYQGSIKGHFMQEITAEDGSTSKVEVSFEVQISVSVGVAQTTNKSDPIALDMNKDGQISTTDVNGGTAFDINGDGAPEQSDYFLALDKNGNGKIDSGKELFGDQNGAQNGFAELACYDSNHDGKIDRNDSVFGDLKAVKLGKNKAIEMYSLAQLGISSISLQYQSMDGAQGAGNSVAQTGSYTMQDGSSGLAADMLMENKRVA